MLQHIIKYFLYTDMQNSNKYPDHSSVLSRRVVTLSNDNVNGLTVCTTLYRPWLVELYSDDLWIYSSLYKSMRASNASTVTVSVPISELLSLSYTVIKIHNKS